MFWDSWIPRKYLVKSGLGVLEMYLHDQDSRCYFTQVQQKNKSLNVQETQTLPGSRLPESFLKKKLPLLLLVNGKGVLLKKLENLDPNLTSLDDILHQALPAIPLQEFYAQLFRQDGGPSFICFCRKLLLDPILEDLRRQNPDLAGVCLGPAAVLGLQALWSNLDVVTLAHQEAQLSNGILENVRSQESDPQEMINMAGIHVPRAHLLGLACSLTYYMQQPPAESNDQELNLLPKKHREANILRFVMLLIVGFSLCLALVNMFVYSSYFDKNNRLETELSLYQGKYDQVNQLLSDYQKNKDLIEDAGLLGKSRLSEYADQIAKTLPDDVLLTNLWFNPLLDKEVMEDSLQTFQNRKIILQGNCAKSFRVNEWLQVLKMQRFVADLSLEKFVYNNTSNLPNFEVNLTVRP